MWKKFDKDQLAVELNNYLAKIVNAYIANDLDAWQRNFTYNFKFKNWLFGATSVVKNSDREKYVYTDCGITTDISGSWSFDNDNAKNVTIVGFDNSSSSHADNCKYNFSLLG